MSSSKTTDTVQLNVGGTKYTVSKALFEQYPTTMLARLVSDTWHKDPAKEIFIDRDGNTFSHVLGYMRNLMVSLSLKQASKETVQRELAYFGFENVPDAAIQDSSSAVEVAEYLSAKRKGINERYRAKLGEIRSEVDILQEHARILQEQAGILQEQAYFEMMAHQCFNQYCLDKRRNVKVEFDVTGIVMKKCGVNALSHLNECLRYYGLRCTSLFAVDFTVSQTSKTTHAECMVHLEAL
jgi:BTB/POZ domain